MWTRSSRFYGIWLDIESIKEDPLGHYYHGYFSIDHVNQDVQHAL
jgi:hypothetical protein